MTQTRIIATISDTRCDKAFIKSLHDSGMTDVRINTAHITLDALTHIVGNIRAVSPHIGILIDTKGPEVRTTATAPDDDTPIQFTCGDKTTFVSAPDDTTTRERICLTHPDIAPHLREGMHMLLDDGFLEFVIDRIDRGTIYATALNSATLGSRKSVNLPQARLDLPPLTERDIAFINHAIDLGIDYIAHSFVRQPSDILAVKQLLTERGGNIKLIAKIENNQGIENFDAILDVSHGALIARGDLGVEIPAEKIPTIQRDIIEKCNRRHKPVIVSTQMLHSMIENPRPTRAEVSDVALAVHQHADALLLTGETATGKYPQLAVATMAAIVTEAEQSRTQLISAKRYLHQSIEEQLNDYLLTHIDPEPPMLARLNRDTHLYHLYPRMCSGHLQGRILSMLSHMIHPRLILELGTFTGYSALCLAEGMREDAHLHTIEIDDESEEFILQRFQSSSLAKRLHLHIGDALDIIPTIEGEFDLVFIDANKRNYIDYYEMVLPRVAKGGYILADNTLWDGKVVDPQSKNDPQTRGILDFNDLVARDTRVQKVILPLRDGLTLIRKL